MKINYPDEDFSAVDAIQYAIDGKREKALNILKSKGEDFHLFDKSELLAQLKLKDDLINELQKHYDPENGTAWNRYLSLKNNPRWDFIRSDHRFQKILAPRKEQYEKNLAKYGDIEELLN